MTHFHSNLHAVIAGAITGVLDSRGIATALGRRITVSPMTDHDGNYMPEWAISVQDVRSPATLFTLRLEEGSPNHSSSEEGRPVARAVTDKEPVSVSDQEADRWYHWATDPQSPGYGAEGSIAIVRLIQDRKRLREALEGIVEIGQGFDTPWLRRANAALAGAAGDGEGS